MPTTCVKDMVALIWQWWLAYVPATALGAPARVNGRFERTLGEHHMIASGGCHTRPEGPKGSPNTSHAQIVMGWHVIIGGGLENLISSISGGIDDAWKV